MHPFLEPIFVLQSMQKTSFILLFLISFQAFSQSKTDDKTNELAHLGVPIDLLNQANKLAKSNPQKSMQLASTALERSISNKDKTTEYFAYITLGSLYYNIENYSKASEYFTKANAGFNAIKDEKGRKYSEKYLTLCLEKQKKYSEVLKMNEATLKRSSNSSQGEINKTKYNKARIKSKAGKTDEAIDELESLSQEDKIAPDTKIDIYNELGELYQSKSDTVKAYNAWYKVLELDHSPEIRQSISQTNKEGYIDAANKVSDMNLKGNRVAENFAIQNQLLTDGLKSKNLDLIQSANFNIGSTYLQQKKEVKAIPYFSESAKLAKKTGNKMEEQKSIKALATAYENLGQFDNALKVYKRYIQISDSFKSISAQSNEANLALNTEFIKQEQRIKGLMQSQKEKELRLSKQKNLVWTLSAILIVFAMLTWALFRNIEQKKKANMVIKLQSLRTQMNPHFIFNSLNSVNNFIAKNDERSANKYISDFSKLMRTVLKNSDQDFVGLDSEIETLKIYLELEHFRFGDKFDYSLIVDPNVEPENVQIPPMLIQPYIENAIWHGLRYKDEKGQLDVKFFLNTTKLYCTVADNGIGREKSSALKTKHQKSYQSTGIKNTKERIELLNKLHRTSLGISITDLEENGAPSGTLVKISLPYIMQNV